MVYTTLHKPHILVDYIIKDELNKSTSEVNIPILEEHQVYEKINRAKKPHSTAPGDLNRLLVKECSVELISPVTKIYNEITKSKEFPRAWVIDQQTFQNPVTGSSQ